MKLEDIIALAKAGYKPSEVKELMELQQELPKEEPPKEEPPKEEPPKEELPKEEPPKEDEKDKTISDLQAQLADIQSKLDIAQKANQRMDQSGNGSQVLSDEDILIELGKHFYD
jgi:DNA-binding transcriptional MerR regulator